MVHGLTAQLGGAFLLSSQPGVGTKAALYLPVSEDMDMAVTNISHDVPLTAPQALSILVVDDEELVRMATAEMLRTLGHDVVEAEGGAEALQLLKARQDIQIVVTDYKMPRMDGAELAQHVRAAKPSMPMLLISGYTGTADPIADLPRLNKPFGLVELAHALDQVSSAQETRDAADSIRVG
jgi:CheY-like chemotaxis protein